MLRYSGSRTISASDQPGQQPRRDRDEFGIVQVQRAPRRHHAAPSGGGQRPRVSSPPPLVDVLGLDREISKGGTNEIDFLAGGGSVVQYRVEVGIGTGIHERERSEEGHTQLLFGKDAQVGGRFGVTREKRLDGIREVRLLLGTQRRS